MLQQVGNSDELRHISTGLFRKIQTPEIGIQPFAFVLSDGFSYGACTRVVTGKREHPVAIEATCKVFEVIKGRVGSAADVAATVMPPVLMQPVGATCRRYKLPHA